jgi:chromatin remodeling complex protein RSC6
MPSNKKVSAPKKIVKKTPVVAKDEVVAPVETVAPVKDEVVDSVTLVDAPVNTVDTYADEFTHLLDQLKSLQTTLKDLSVYTTKLERRVAKDQKAVQKRVNGKRKRTNTSSSPTGFSKPGPVSDELRAFLKIEAGELVARTEVTKRINAYCKEHGLQGKEDKRILKPDKVLKTLLRLGKNDELTFFNLQKYMKVHFPNKEGVYPTL